MTDDLSLFGVLTSFSSQVLSLNIYLYNMAGRCTGCTNKYGFFEHPRLCPECKRQFCESCLPHLPPDSKKKRKKSEPLFSVNPCVYCIKQKDISKAEEAEIVENFQERFYKHSRTEPPIQSRIHQDLARGLSSGEDGRPSRLTGKDRDLEERLRKLKEPKNPGPSANEGDIRDRLANLRGESSPGPSHSPPKTGGTTQVEQARDLIDQTTEEVELDQKLEETIEKQNEDIFRRLQALKGIKETDDYKKEVKTPDVNVDSLLDDFEIEIPDEDPDKLLGDFQKFQVKQEMTALAEAEQEDIKKLIAQAKELAKEDKGAKGEDSSEMAKLSTITYPDLNETEAEKEKQEVSKLVSDVMKEVEQEKETGNKASTLGEEEDEGDVVRSKLDHPQNLDVSWDHFGQRTSAPRDNLQSAARQLGIQASTDEEDPEIKTLIEKMKAEAELDKKLELSGHGVRPTPPANEQSGAAKPWPEASGDDDEFPWCCICNNDATMRCHDCDDDLYCTQCFSEGHEQFGLFDHRYSPFEPQRKQS